MQIMSPEYNCGVWLQETKRFSPTGDSEWCLRCNKDSATEGDETLLFSLILIYSLALTFDAITDKNWTFYFFFYPQ